MFRVYVERKAGFQNEAERIYSEVKDFLGISGISGVRYLNRYDVENVSDEVAKAAAIRIFSEPQSDYCLYEKVDIANNETVIIWEYLPGQYDQRADSAEQCLSLLRASMASSVEVGTLPPKVRCAKMVILKGSVSAADVKKIEEYLINPVDSRLADDKKPETLEIKTEVPGDIPVVDGFIAMDDSALTQQIRTRRTTIQLLKNIVTKWVLLWTTLILNSFRIILRKKIVIQLKQKFVFLIHTGQTTVAIQPS